MIHIKACFLLFLLFAIPSQARVFMIQKEALKVAFTNASSVERKTLFLTEKQAEEIQGLAKSKMDTQLATYYIGKNAQEILGYAFFDTHIVRTMPESFMAVVNPDGTLRLVELLAFHEPEDYLPPKKWLGLFSKKKLDNELWVKRGIRNITGATLTTQAITEGVRKILALFEVAVKKGNAK